MDQILTIFGHFSIAWFRAEVDLTKNVFYEKVLFFTQFTPIWWAVCWKNLKVLSISYGLYQLRTEVPPKIQRSIWELILMHLPSTKMLAQYSVEVLSTALNSLVAGLTSLKIWSTKSAKKRHLCTSISAQSLHSKIKMSNYYNFFQH